MKRVFAVLLIICSIQLTLASDTQYRFKVYVKVDGDDEQAVNTIENYLKRELRLIGDVDVVGENDDWKYIINIVVMALDRKDGTKTGNFAIASYKAVRLEKNAYKNPETDEVFKPTFDGTLSAAYFPRENLHECCIRLAGAFDESHLEVIRNAFRRVKR